LKAAMTVDEMYPEEHMSGHVLREARERGAGPRITLPSLLYWEPWQGHLNLFSALFQGTTQPRWVHTALRP